MQKIIRLVVVNEERKLSVNEAWERFAELMARSKDTLDLNDGIAAGKAYRVFLEACTRAGL